MFEIFYSKHVNENIIMYAQLPISDIAKGFIR